MAHSNHVIIVAGGSGIRMKSQRPKQFLLLHGLPMFIYAVKAFRQVLPAIHIVLVVPHDYIEEAKQLLKRYYPEENQIDFCVGGEKRFYSVAHGLKKIKEYPGDLIAIHDAARPMLSCELIRKAFQIAKTNGNAVPVIPVKDSIRLIDKHGNKAIDRKNLVSVQTPQVFEAVSLKNAYTQAYEESFTDSASVMEAAGNEIYLFPGDSSNIKITNQTDFDWVKLFLEKRNITC